MWVKDENCRVIVDQCWGSDTQNVPFSQTLDRCSSLLADWGKRKRREMFKLVNDHIKSLQQAHFEHGYPFFQKIVCLEEKFNKALDEEEMYWKQRSRENWLKWGDKNTKWFHKKANMRRKRNTIDKIKDANGHWVSNPEELPNVFVDYFSKLFKSVDVSEGDMDRALNCISRCVTNEMNDCLLAPCSEEEIWVALFQMCPTKAPEPDGFPALFYQHFWDSVKDKTIETCLNVLNKGASVQSLNHTNIALIPKIMHPQGSADFRPISLCNVSYKIISKVLANRLKKILILSFPSSRVLSFLGG